MKKRNIIIVVVIIFIILLVLFLFTIKFNKKDEIPFLDDYVYLFDLGSSSVSVIKCDDKKILIGTGSSEDRYNLEKILSDYKFSDFDYIVIKSDDETVSGNLKFLVDNYDIKYVYLKEDSKYSDYFIVHYTQAFVVKEIEKIDFGRIKMEIYDDDYSVLASSENHCIYFGDNNSKKCDVYIDEDSSGKLKFFWNSSWKVLSGNKVIHFDDNDFKISD